VFPSTLLGCPWGRNVITSTHQISVETYFVDLIPFGNDLNIDGHFSTTNRRLQHCMVFPRRPTYCREYFFSFLFSSILNLDDLTCIPVFERLAQSDAVRHATSADSIDSQTCIHPTESGQTLQSDPVYSRKPSNRMLKRFPPRARKNRSSLGWTYPR
jgi:hypothetical protein